MSQSSSPKKLFKDAVSSVARRNNTKHELALLTNDLPAIERLPSIDVDDLIFLDQVSGVSKELSSEAVRRLESLDAWRRMNEEPYSRGRNRLREPSSVNITEKMAPILERHIFEPPMSAVEPDTLDEAGFILRHFDDSRCNDFKPAKHQTIDQEVVCSICGLSEEFHRVEDETEGITAHLEHENQLQTDGRGVRNTEDAIAPGKRPALRLDVPSPDTVDKRKLDVTGGRLPATSFGSIIIPHRFLGRIREDSLGGSYKGQFTRKYLRFNADTADEKLSFVWDLLTRIWNLNPPTLVMSVTGGSVKSMDANVRNSLSEALNRIVSRTDVWMITDGRNYGASRFLGQLLSDATEQGMAEEKQPSVKGRGQKTCVPVLIGVSHWGSLRRKALLMSISSPDSRSSRYFYSMEYKLAREEHSRILNPYQSAYLLLDNGNRNPDECVQKFRANFDRYLAAKTVNQIDGRFTIAEYISKTTLPVLTLVLGGDGERTIDQVIHSVKSKYPVIVVKGSSSVPTLLAELFYALEDKVPRSGRAWNNDSMDWDEREDRVFQNYITRFKEHIKVIFNIKTSDASEDISGAEAKHLEDRLSRILDKLTEIMKCRFYITVIDCELETGDNLCNSILRGMYKGYSRVSGLTIALKTCRPEFLQALFDRSDEPSQQEFTKNFITVSTLNDLHRENFCRTSGLSKILKMMCKRESYDVKRKPERNFLPLVGRVLHLLMGPRYRVMYHDEYFLELIDNPDFSRKRWQVWHLFLWSVLSGKPAMTRFFVAQSSAPLGMALIAYQLYSRLARWANKGYEEELKSFLDDCAEEFQQLAIDLLDFMYENDAEGAYRVLISELPFELGPYITPLVIADDAQAMDFMSQGGCQTFLQRVWKGNMVVETPNWRSWPVFFFLPFLSFPWIHFYNSSLSAKDTPKKDEPSQQTESRDKNAAAEPEVNAELKTSMTTLDESLAGSVNVKIARKSRHSHGDEEDYGSTFDHFIFFLTAPITKFYSGMIAYISFLGLLSYYVLTELRPFTSLNDVTGVEWVLISWNISLFVEEMVQVFGVNDTGPLYGVSKDSLQKSTWHKSEILKIHMYPVVMYLRNGRWNAIDVTILGLFVISYILRFTLPLELFQMCRFAFAITVIFSYFRLLRFWFVLPSVGPRVIAMQMMLTELLKFLSVLIVFILGFGVAFQAILNPNQPFSTKTIVDVFWRTFWQMFGELFLDDTTTMGRDVSEQSCYAIKNSMNESSIYCLAWAAPVMLGVYLLIANVLLLNLLIATFSQAYEDVKSKAHTVYLYNLYSLIQECYYQTTLPPPLSLFQRFCLCVWSLVKLCRDPTIPPNRIIEDSFRLKASPYTSRLQKKACDSIKPYNSYGSE